MDIPKSETLIALQEERETVRAKLKADQSALTRAQQNVATWTQRQAEAETLAAVQEAADIERLTAWISDGEPADKPPAMPDEEAAQRLAQARLNLSIALKAQTSLQAAHKATADELAKMDKAIAAEADRLMYTRREELAERVEVCYDQLRAAVEILRTFAPDYLNTPVNVLRAEVPPRVAMALALLPRLEDDLHKSMPELRGQYNSAAPWAAMREALIT